MTSLSWEAVLELSDPTYLHLTIYLTNLWLGVGGCLLHVRGGESLLPPQPGLGTASGPLLLVTLRHVEECSCSSP